MRVEVVAYDDSWPERFRHEERHLRRVLPSEAVVEHVGSTAVPGMPAKPIIDIAVGIPTEADADDITVALLASGRYIRFKYLERWLPERRYLVVLHDEVPRRGWPDVVESEAEAETIALEHRRCQIHIVAASSNVFSELVRLRDLLRCNPDARDRYARTKLELCKLEFNSTKDYAIRKDEVITELLGPALNATK